MIAQARRPADLGLERVLDVVAEITCLGVASVIVGLDQRLSQLFDQERKLAGVFGDTGCMFDDEPDRLALRLCMPSRRRSPRRDAPK